ncbi:GGDEF domain-containing protein [Sandarakinorhabdus sp. AAP62]|uniref:GGDEF domain-containing protein n=1 Tax=Sandarakinorhabdus sp. AAP62 TaxID=1248916 RepID=UPI0002E71C7C|nr:GGDEF domain-containing protein [Sandarakinorhabdus sp. AAP62]
MKHQPGPMVAEKAVPAPPDVAFPAGSGPLANYDQIRTLLIQTGLPPEPSVYDVLWRYVRDEDPELSLAIDKAIAGEGLTLGVVMGLRETLLGQMSEAQVNQLIAEAHGQAEALTKRIESGQTDLADYGRAIANGGEQLAGPMDATALAGLLEQLSSATSTVQAANGRLLKELEQAAAESRALADRLTQAERAAVTDALTGVLNRRGLMAAVEKAQADAAAAGAPLAVAVVDIDHFKRFNDRFGHAMGDDVLRFVARHLADRLEQDGGLVGRLGGEEFVGVMPGTSVQAAAGRIDRVRADLAGQVLRSAVDGSSMGRISFSAGVAEHRDGQGPDQLIERADGALYTAKRLGRDRVVPDRG